MGAILPQVSVLLLGVVAVLVTPCRSFVTPQESVPSHQLSSHKLTSSELMLSVLVNQMALLRMFNQTSTYWSSHEAAMAQYNASHQDAKEELQRSLEAALVTIQEKKNEALDEVTEKKEQELVSFKESAVNELTNTKQQILEELTAAREGRTTMKIFKLHRISLNHSEAMHACNREGGRLAVPENEEENEQLLSMANMNKDKPVIGAVRYETGPNSSLNVKHVLLYWIGGDDKEEEGVWVNSNTGLPLTYTNFAAGEPNNRFVGGEHCLTIWLNNGWNDGQCHWSTHGYFCEFTVAVV